MAKKTKYSDKELIEFKKIIEDKLSKTTEELRTLTDDIKRKDNTTSDTDGGHVNMFEDGFDTIVREEQNIHAARLHKLVQHLQAALRRVETKNYGYCRETGKLIPKERLMAVPHATLSIEAKSVHNLM